MADYYPLIARAIAGLDPNAPGESRRALYERARTALIAQLRSVQPPLSESEITRERLSLEEAVRKVESEAAQRARDANRPGGGGPRGGDAFRRANARPPEAEAPPGAPSGPPRQRPPGQPPVAKAVRRSARTNSVRAICAPTRRRKAGRARRRRRFRCRILPCRRNPRAGPGPAVVRKMAARRHSARHERLPRHRR